MSETSDVAEALMYNYISLGVLSKLQDGMLNSHISLNTGLVAYEYIVTFDQEVNSVWARPPSATSVLLVTTRWVMVLNQIINWVPFSQSSTGSCRVIDAVSFSVFFAAMIQMALFSGLRVYALWRDSRLAWVFLAFVFASSSVPIGTNIFQLSRTSAVYEGSPFYDCIFPVDISDRLNRTLLILTRTSALVADLTVLILTWAKTFQHWRQLRRLKIGTSVSSLLLRDGTFYFLALVAINIAQTFSLGAISTSGTWSDITALFLQAMPSLLAQRFMLNLRQFSQPEQQPGADASAVRFSRFSVNFRVPSDLLGDIGGSLEHAAQSTVNDSSDQGDSSETPWINDTPQLGVHASDAQPLDRGSPENLEHASDKGSDMIQEIVHVTV